MPISKAIKDKLQKYGLNLPYKMNTKAYSKILRDNGWTPKEYEEYLKKTTNALAKKEKSISTQVQKNKFIQEVRNEVSEKNKTRYVGNILVELIITEDKTQEGNGLPMERFESFKSRNQTKNKNVFIEFHDIHFDKKLSHKKEIKSIVQYLIKKLVNKIMRRPYVIDVDIERVSEKIHQYSSKNMKDIRMKQAGSLQIDGYDTQPWDTKKDTCVFDYIIHTYKNIDGFKKQCNYESLQEIFNNGYSIREGVSAVGIMNFCRRFKLPMHAYDNEEKHLFPTIL
jgi:hypothetical protein